MDKRKERYYMRPQTEVIFIKQSEYLLGTSPVNGGHHSAEDDGESLNGKPSGFFFEEESAEGKN